MSLKGCQCRQKAVDAAVDVAYDVRVVKHQAIVDYTANTQLYRLQHAPTKRLS